VQWKGETSKVAPEDMELNGALSNPRAGLEGSFVGLLRVAVAALGRRELIPRRVVRPKPVPVQAVVEALVRAAGRPVRVSDVCAAVMEQAIGPFDPASVRKTLHDGCRGESRRFTRVGWGLYESA
jgi:hypothetical protein